MRSSQNTIACTSRRGLWVVLLINLVSTLLPQRPAILKKMLCSWPPCVKNKLGGGWIENWFYVHCPEGKGWPQPRTLSLFQFEVFSHFEVAEKDHNYCAFGFTTVTYNGRDLVEEYLACGI